MKKIGIFGLILTAIAFLPVTASADTTTFNTYTSPGVNAAINSDGFFVGSDLFGAHAYSSGPWLFAGGPGYSDAGIALYFNGGLTLGQLQSVSVSGSGDPLAVNLWFDTGNDGKFFSFTSDSGLLTSLSGDSYAGCGAPTLTTASTCFMFGGNGIGSIHSLADLQAGAISGISGSTPIALWVGITNPGDQNVYAELDSITVTTASPVPEPATMTLFGTGLIGLGGLVRRRFRR